MKRYQLRDAPVRGLPHRAREKSTNAPGPRNSIRWLAALAASFYLASASAQLLVTDTNDPLVDPALLAATLLGPDSDAVVLNVTLTGDPSCAGIFSGGAPLVGFDSGVVLGSGMVINAPGPNSQPGFTTGFALPGDPFLEQLAGSITFDACSLELQFECPDTDMVSFMYVFASEEYNEFVEAGFNDPFGFELNGSNIALLPGGVLPVAIDNVNGGNPGACSDGVDNDLDGLIDLADPDCFFPEDNIVGENNSNSELYINNDCFEPDGGLGCPIDLEADGLTVVLGAEGNLVEGPNIIRLIVGDAGDPAFDSWVHIEEGSFQCGALGGQPPEALCQDVTTSVDGSCLAFVSPTDVDNGSSDPDGDPVTLSLDPAGPYPLGATLVDLIVVDSTGLESSCSATITAEDFTPPTIIVPPDVAACPTETDPSFTGTAIADDNCDPPTVTFSDTFVPGATPEFGTIIRTWTATDPTGNTASATQLIEVVDCGNQPPVAVCTDVTAAADGSCLADVSVDGGSFDPDGDPISLTQAPPSPYGLGTTDVTLTVTDPFGLNAMCGAVVEVLDVTAPTIIVPADVTLECPAVIDPSVTGTAIGIDNCDAPFIEFTDTFTPGGAPGTGTTLRTWTATDGSGNTASGTQQIEVFDTTVPVITCPANVQLEPTDLTCGVTFDSYATVTDACDAAPTITSSVPLPAVFDMIGDHTVTFTATDASGNVASCETTVTVLPTPYCQKTELVDHLEGLLAVDTHDDDLIDAIGYLHMSLGEDDERAGMDGSEVVWGDPTHVDECNGGYKGADVFQYEQAACDKLDAWEENDENQGFGFGAEIEAARQAMAEADQTLAETAIDDAVANNGKRDDIRDARELKAEGDAAKAAGGPEICDEALDKYEEAWEKSSKSWCDY